MSVFWFPVGVNGQSPLTNQNLFDTTPFLPEHYTERIALFDRQSIEEGRIIFLGDSITEGGDWGRLSGDSTVVNRGISGDITFGVLKRMNDVVRRKPSKLFILIGINDIGKDIPTEVIADNIRQIVALIRKGSPETRIFLQSVLPVNPNVDRFPQHYAKGEYMVHLNRLLRIVAASMDVTFVDLYEHFVDAGQRLDARYTTDGLHLNAQGYERWITFLKEAGYL